MSKPKPSIGSAKRRGLAIATAVAVTGSGIATTNYVSALEEDRDPTYEELQRDFAGTEADAIAKEAAQKAHDALVAGNHDQVDQTFLEALNKAAGAGGSGFTKEDIDAVGEEELKYQIGNLVADEKEPPRLDRRIAAEKNKNNSGETASEDDETPKAPTVDEAFEAEKATIQALLEETKDTEKAARQVAGKYKQRFDNDDAAFGKFEFQLERKVKKYYTELVESGVIGLAPEFVVPSAEEAFERAKEETVKPRLIAGDDPVQVGKDVAGQYRHGFADDAVFGQFEFKLEQAAKKYYTELVESGVIGLAPEFVVPSAE
ncbi:hypothetical protein QPX11_07895, partial [Corynebacterium propinquum]|uniref:hypothetical protein n=1 Tax=Corynebacterium propinquum TaxID=43769 RepID=UPI002543666E